MGLRACTCAADCASGQPQKQRRGQAGTEDSIPCQPAAQTGRQSPALAGAKRPHFIAKQFLFVQPVLPEQSSALTISFLWLSPCGVTSSVLSLTPGSSHPTAPWPRCSTWDPCPEHSLLRTVWPLQVKAKSSQESLQQSLEHLGEFFLLPLLTMELHGTVVPQVKRTALGHNCGA